AAQRRRGADVFHGEDPRVVLRQLPVQRGSQALERGREDAWPDVPPRARGDAFRGPGAGKLGGQVGAGSDAALTRSNRALDLSPPTDAPIPLDNRPPAPSRAAAAPKIGGARRAKKRVTLRDALAVGSSAKAKPVPIHPDLLGELAAENARVLKAKGWRWLARLRRGRSALNKDVWKLPHDAAGYLSYLQRHGAPVHSSAAPKSPDELQAAVDRGAHPSAIDHQEFLWEEAYEMCQRRHTMVLPFSAVKHLEGVQISPPGVVPQQGRRPRTICDLTYSGVNATTVELTHGDAMRFGRALRRILFQIYRADPRWDPVYLSKIYISDGFYNVCVNANGSKHFGIVLPTPPGEEPLILFFLGLPMGWVSSPPTFCALTESAADVANDRIDANWAPPGHRCDSVADTPTESTRPASKTGPPPRIRHRVKGPVGRTDVYVDDFILLAQGGKRRRKRLRRILFHCIDMIFRPPDAKDDKWKKDPISLKKLLKGDGALETVKVILGWLVDTVAGTIELPPNRVERLKEILAAFPRSRKTQAGRGAAQAVCSSPCRQFHDAIDDFRWLAEDVIARPTRLAEVVPEAPAFVGTVDASGTGMGGVWLPDGDALYSAALDPASLEAARDFRRGGAVSSAMAARERSNAALFGPQRGSASSTPSPLPATGTSRIAGDPEGGGRPGSRTGLGLPSAGRGGPLCASTDLDKEVAHAACRRDAAGMPVPGGRYGFTDLDKEVTPRATDLNKEVRPAALDKVLGGSLPLPRDVVTMKEVTQATTDLNKEVAPTACRRGAAGMPVPGGRYGFTDLDKEVTPRATDLNKEVRPAALDKVLGGSLPLPERRVTMDCPHDDETVPARALLRDGRPILWRIPFPDDIVTALVSDSNPDGIINNSELELAGIVATNDVLARAVDVRETTTATGTDNLPALSWSTKGAVSAKGPAAYLLRHQAMHQRVFRYQSPQAVADLPPGARDRLGPVLRSAMQAAASAGNPKRGRQRANAYARWSASCAAFNVDPLLQGVPRPIPFMQTYIQQYRTGVVAARGQPVGARAAEEALRFVGQTMQQLGSDDDPPARVKPIPMMVLMKAQERATADNSTASTCTARMMWIHVLPLSGGFRQFLFFFDFPHFVPPASAWPPTPSKSGPTSDFASGLRVTA
ncbi:hypothetical protein THAOC_20968, partial [Thalassiosira oceanica]